MLLAESPAVAAPIYQRIARELYTRIVTSEIPVGGWLPSEAELEASYGVSRTPIRRALQELEQVGLITRMQGRGSLVRSRTPVATQVMMGLTAELVGRGRTVEQRQLEAGLVPCPADAAAELGLANGTAVVVVQRLLWVDGTPSVVLRHYVHPRCAATVQQLRIGAEVTSMYGHLAALGFAPYHARQSVGAVRLDMSTASSLAEESGAPALMLRRLTRAVDGLPIEYSEAWIRADKYSLETEVLDKWR